jgi:hypothetical protein
MNRQRLPRRWSVVLSFLLLTTLLTTMVGAQASIPVDYNVTTPRAFFGYDIGQDYKLTPWQTHVLTGEGVRKGIVEYAHELERTSNRVHVFEYGKTEMGRPMILTVVTSPENWAKIDSLKGILAKMADPRQVANDDEAKYLAQQGKAVYWMSAAIHSTERTSPEVLLRLGYQLASSNDDRTMKILDNLIVVMENTINPDGLEMVTDWYYQYKDTPYASSTPPYYGKYVNHDDNRDFVGISLIESQNNVKARMEWNPTVYHDLHQTKDLLYMSPGNDPTNEAVSPITSAEWLAFAGHNITQLIAAGWKGVFTYDYADMWYPGYNHGYSFMHNTNGRFYELQGASLATPLAITRPETRGRTWYNPLPYTVPITWHLMDAVNLEQDALLNDLTYTANNKDNLIYNFYLKGKTNMQKAMSQAPYAFVIPQNGGNNPAVVDMINNLRLLQNIEVDRAGTAFSVAGSQFAAGDYVVHMDQPYGLTAKNLLTVQNYPPIKVPYDVTAWTYGLMRDVRVISVTSTLPAGLSLLPVTASVSYAGTLTGDVSTHYAIEHQTNNNWSVALPRLWADPHMVVSQVDQPFSAGGHALPAGTFLVRTSGSAADHAKLKALVEELGLTGYSITNRVPSTRLVKPKLGTYTTNNSSNTTMPEGWSRLRLDRSGWDYTRLYPADVLTGTVSAYNVIILPDAPTSTIVNGSPTSTSLPPEYRVGMGAAGVAKLKQFVMDGGTLVLQGRSSVLPIEQNWGISVTVPSAALAAAWSAPISDNPEDLPDFGGAAPRGVQAAAAPTANCPGSIVRIKVDPTTKVGYGYNETEALWCESSTPYFVPVSGGTASVVASYPATGDGDLLLSGYLDATADAALRGKAAIVDAPLGAGHVVLLAPNVLYRAQSAGTFMFFWNSLIEGSRRGPAETWAYFPFILRQPGGGGQ